MSTPKTKVGTKLGLTTIIAAVAMAAVPFAATAAGTGYPISTERAKALQACSGMADEWGYAYRACMGQHGEAE
jgi:hypothetical protein